MLWPPHGNLSMPKCDGFLIGRPAGPSNGCSISDVLKCWDTS